MTPSNTNPTTQTELEKAIEILPCPFCGRSNFQRWKDSDPWRRIQCASCKAIAPAHSGFPVEESEQMAIKTWNTRIAAKQLSALEAKCAEKDEALKIAAAIASPGHVRRGWSLSDASRRDTILKALSSTCGQNYISKDKVNSAIDTFENKQRGIPQAHLAAELVKELRTTLAKAEGLIE